MRVFKEVILSNLIEPKFKKKDLDFFDYKSITYYAQEIINSSIKEYCEYSEFNNKINKKLLEYENNIFILNNETNYLLNNEINYASFVSMINSQSPLNLRWLSTLEQDYPINNDLALRFPIKIVLIVEGITEEILLPVFAQKCGFDFDKYGVQLISAGGKNQVVKKFYTLSEQLKIPIFVLLDSDAIENYEQIKLKKRKFDKIHIIKSGEFEDILPKPLIERTLNDYLANMNFVNDEDFKYDKMVENLEDIFKSKGFHEFKKAEFAQLVKKHIGYNFDVSLEIQEIITQIKSILSF